MTAPRARPAADFTCLDCPAYGSDTCSVLEGLGRSCDVFLAASSAAHVAHAGHAGDSRGRHRAAPRTSSAVSPSPAISRRNAPR